jgi:hypothetical protein
VFGIIKSALGFRQFSLVTMAWNIRRIFALAPAPA